MGSDSKPAAGLLDWLKRVDCRDVDGYRAAGGYAAVDRVLKAGPAETLDVLARSGLRGLDGDGAPTAEKWRSVQGSPRPEKYLLANADGGDYLSIAGPTLLELGPQAVIEGLLLGALTVGSEEALVYVHEDDRAALDSYIRAVDQARSRGYVGPSVLGTDRSFELFVVTGRERMICGEGGSRPAEYIEARLKLENPPNSMAAATGLVGYPLLACSVETWVNVALILNRVVEGTPGTKLLTVVGSVNRPGLIEAPLGTTLGELIDDCAKGVFGGELKAVHIGGLGGGFIPTDNLDVVLDFESLSRAGVNFGSGVVRVLAESDCVVNTMIEMARRAVMTFEPPLSPYQLSINRLTRLLTAMAEGGVDRSYFGTLEGMSRSEVYEDDCGGARSVANTVSTALSHFREELEGHVEREACPAGACFAWEPAACQAACPAGIDVPDCLALISQGRYREAIGLIREDNPFPWISGLVCPHSCEAVCRQRLLRGPISIMRLKAFAASRAMAEGGYPEPAPKPDAGHKAAIVGSGPAGLTAAYYLRLAGHRVTVFEALPVAGGMCSMGIPEYRLPREVVRREIEAVERLGIEIKLGVRVGRDVTLDELREQGYGAVFIGAGAPKGLPLEIDGAAEFEPIHDGLSFLGRVARGDRERPADEVVVIGGGQPAIAAARTAVRLGCRSVTVAFSRTSREMPFFDREGEQALEEGVRFHFLSVPKRVIGQGGRVLGLECLRAKPGRPDSSGRMRPVPIEGSEFVIKAGAIIVTTGHRPDPEEIIAGTRIEFSAGHGLAADPVTLQTGEPDVFAGGDVVTGPASVIEAIAAGKAAARSMDLFLRGRPLPTVLVEPRRREPVERVLVEARDREWMMRPSMPLIPLAARKESFEEVETRFDEATARREASRCLRCDLCDGRGLCQMVCAETGVAALRMEVTPTGRLACLDFERPARMCVGCGSCSNVCPVDNIRVEDSEGVRRMIIGGTIVNELPMVRCKDCGRFYATRVYMDYIFSREDRPADIHSELCPECYRRSRARAMAGHPFDQS